MDENRTYKERPLRPKNWEEDTLNNYGIKHLKRIGTLFFSNIRPPDYWYERGYDYYSGL